MSVWAVESGFEPPRPLGGSAGQAVDLALPRFFRDPARRRIQREDVPRDVDCPITVRQLLNQRFDTPWHYHPELELTLILNGTGVRHVGDSIEEFGPGDLVLVGSNTPHCWLSPASAPKTDAAIVVQFPATVFGEGFLTLLETRPLALLIQRAAVGLHFAGAARDEAARLLHRLALPGISRLERLSGLVSLLTVLASRGGGRPLTLTAARPTVSRESSRASEVLRYIRANAAQRLSRAELARVAGMASGTFSRFFARQFGKPFVAYVAEVRVANACRVLREQDLSVSEVAHEVGFHNLANFNRTFLRLKGMTPTAYRRMARSAV